MTQSSFDFASPPNKEAEEIQKWVEKHNQQIIRSAHVSSVPPGSLLGAIDGAEARANTVYLLRGVMGQILRKSIGSGPVSFKKGFLQSLRAEMSIKKSSRNSALTLRDILIKMHSSR
jgi:hypothetical protein